MLIKMLVEDPQSGACVWSERKISWFLQIVPRVACCLEMVYRLMRR